MPNGYTRWCFTLNFSWTLDGLEECSPPCPDDFLGNENIRYMIYSEEVGRNGNYHFQGYLELFKRWTLNQMKTQLDSGAHWIHADGDLDSNIAYCSKVDDPTFVDGPWIYGTPFRRPNIAASFDRIRDGLKDPSSDLKVLEDENFGMFARYGTYFKDYRKRRCPRPVEVRDASTFNRPLEDVTYGCLLFFGASNIGKTQYAKSHFRCPLLVRDIDTLKSLDPTYHDGIVFDDMSFKHWPADAIKHLLDWDEESEIRCRYANAVIPSRFPRIFTANSSDIFEPKDVRSVDADAINRRFTTVNLGDVKLY